MKREAYRAVEVKQRVDRFVQVAGQSVGVRQTPFDRRRVMECAQAARREVETAERHLKQLAQGHAVLARQAAVVGWVTACVLWRYLGNPANYHCGEAYRKAMGLNLKERSSGLYRSRNRVSKIHLTRIEEGGDLLSAILRNLDSDGIRAPSANRGRSFRSPPRLPPTRSAYTARG